MNCKSQIAVVALLVSAELSVVASESKGRSQQEAGRSPRFLSFDTTTDNIRVDIAFTIPFITIPVKKTLDSTLGSSEIFSTFPSLNVNLGGLVLGGTVVLGSTFLLPFLLKTLTVDSSRPYARILENTEFQSDVFLKSINELMAADGRLLGCARRLACWTARNSDAILTRAGKSTHLLRDLASNSILNSFLNGTSIDSAFRSGYEGYNCTEKYMDCPISHENTKIFMNNLSKLGKV